MNWVLTVALCILVVELAARLPLIEPAIRIAGVSQKAMRVMRAPSISDHWKEKAMLAYSGALFAQSMRAALTLAGICAVAFLAVWGADRFGAGLEPFLLSWTGLVFSTVIAVAYFTIRTRFV